MASEVKNKVLKLAGQKVSEETPEAGELLTWDGTQWAPAEPAPVEVTGDITTGNQNVTGSVVVQADEDPSPLQQWLDVDGEELARINDQGQLLIGHTEAIHGPPYPLYPIEISSDKSAVVLAKTRSAINLAGFQARNDVAGNFGEMNMALRSTESPYSSLGSTRANWATWYITPSISGLDIHTESSSSPIVFGTANIERMRIAGEGNLLIGTTEDDEESKLQVSGSVRIQDRTPETGSTTLIVQGGEGQSGNDLQKWVSDNDVEHARITDDGSILFGASSPANGAKVSVQHDTTASAVGHAFNVTATFTPASSNGVSKAAIFARQNINLGSGIDHTGGTPLRGVQSGIGFSGDGSVTGIAASYGASYFKTSGSGTVARLAFYLVIPAVSISGTVTDAYGLLIQPIKITNIQNAWGVYQEGANDKNYLNGTTLIGTNTDDGSGSKLQVNGDAKATSFSTPSTTPTANSPGVAGQMVWDGDYIYICTATDTWKRVALTSF